MAASCGQSIPATLVAVVTFTLADPHTRDDLRVYLSRLLRCGEAEVRIVTRGGALAVYGCVFAPAGLGDPAPLVLVMRAFALAEAPAEPVDATVEARALLDRLARSAGADCELAVPDASVMVAWAGVLPPVGGWRAQGAVDAESLAEVARQGVARVAAALPERPGEAVVRKVRAEVWGAEIAPDLPAAAAFAADAMGFLGEGPLRLARSRAWLSLSSAQGHVLFRI